MLNEDHTKAPSASFYNSIAPYYDDYCTTSGIEDSQECELNLVESYKPTSILEFGIGTGRFARSYLTRNPGTTYIGVDNAEAMLVYAQDSGATLVHAHIKDYLYDAEKEGYKFDCIIAPYTALHHIHTQDQIHLIETMKRLCDTLILNCLNREAERALFGEKMETIVTFLLPDTADQHVTIYKIEPSLRKRAQTLPDGDSRVFLILTQT